MDYYDKIWYSKNEEEIKKNQYMIMLDLDKKKKVQKKTTIYKSSLK